MYTFAEILTELMNERGLNNVQLEKRSGCANTSISAWLTKGVLPKVENLIKLSSTFNCSIEYLLGLTYKKEFAPSTHSQSFKDRFLEILKNRNVTQYRVHVDCNIERSYISRWMHKNLVPEIQTIVKLAEYLGCSVDYLVGNTDET